MFSSATYKNFKIENNKIYREYPDKTYKTDYEFIGAYSYDCSFHTIIIKLFCSLTGYEKSDLQQVINLNENSNFLKFIYERI